MTGETETQLPEALQWSAGQADAPAFSNEPVAMDLLPDFQRAPLAPVSARFAPYSAINSAIFWLFLVGLAVVGPRLPFLPFELPWWIVVLPALALVWFCSIAFLDARRRRWGLREHDLIYRSGLIWQRTAILPFARIQHVETASGPLERWFGLLRVKCFTAGGMSADLTVEGLEHDAARRVRQYLLEQIRDDSDGQSSASQASTSEAEAE